MQEKEIVVVQNDLTGIVVTNHDLPGIVVGVTAGGTARNRGDMIRD